VPVVQLCSSVIKCLYDC